MKKVLSVLCILSIVMGCLFIPGCGATGMKFFTVDALKNSKAKFTFVDESDVDKDDLVCEIQPDAPASITIPYKVKDKKVAAVIGAKEPAKGLSSVKISEGIKYIEKAFVKFDNLKTVDLPKSVKSVWTSFKSCKKLESLNFKGELSLLIDAVKKCPALKSVVFEDKVAGDIDVGTFADCNALETLEFDADLGSYNTTELSDNLAFKNLTFKGSVNTICEDAFSGCGNLNNINFNGDVGTIGERAFYGTGNVNELVFNSDVDNINASAFETSKAKKLLFKGNAGNIKEKAFGSCDNLESVVFSKTAGPLEENAFVECKKLSRVEFNGKIKGYYSRVFEACDSLKTIVVKRKKDISSYYMNVGVNIGTREMIKFFEKIPNEKIRNQAKKRIGVKFPSNKQMSEGSARKLAKKYNGPIIESTGLSKCNYTKYSRKYAKKSKFINNSSVKINYANEFDYDYAGTIYTKKKASKLKKGKAPVIYCLIEHIGYSGPKVYRSINTRKKITKKYYYYHTRFSFWNYKTGKLIGWFNHRAGYAPVTYKLSDEYKMSWTVDVLRSKRFFLEKNGKGFVPIQHFAKIVFGRKRIKHYK